MEVPDRGDGWAVPLAADSNIRDHLMIPLNREIDYSGMSGILVEI